MTIAEQYLLIAMSRKATEEQHTVTLNENGLALICCASLPLLLLSALLSVQGSNLAEINM